MAEIQGKPDSEDRIREAFSVFDKYDEAGSLNVNEMKHVMSRLGDHIPEEDLNSFFSLLDNGSEFISIEEVVKLM